MRATCSDPLGSEGQAESDGMIQVKGRNQDLNTCMVSICDASCSHSIEIHLILDLRLKADIIKDIIIIIIAIHKIRIHQFLP